MTEPVHVGPARLLEVVRVLAVELRASTPNPPRVTLDTSLERDLGFDSLTRMELLARLEGNFGVTVAESLVATAETPRDLLRGLELAVPADVREDESAVRELAMETAAIPERADTLLDVLEWHVQRHPDRPHVLLDEGGAPVELSYGALWHGAGEIASGLRERGLVDGERVAIMLPTGLDYLFSFFGTLRAGAVPVPIYPPARPSQVDVHLRRHLPILADAQASLLIATSDTLGAARRLRAEGEWTADVATPTDVRAGGSSVGRPACRGDSLAYLQYTSGSTGNPKGVMLSHANLLANIRAMGGALRVEPPDVFVSWLPLYHDMGLIGAWLGTLYHAVPLLLMAPTRFLARPERWLWAIHRHRGTISGAPNFAYELCLRQVGERRMEGLDLRCWRVAFNGAEPVSTETLRRFAERFAAYGLKPEALMPVYGLAENGVGLAFPPLGRAPRVDRIQRDALTRHGRARPSAPEDPAALAFAACGLPLPGHEIRVADDRGVELGEREEGRLQFRGPSATHGYFRNPGATADLLHGDWVDSGDMGYLANGEVFITGRRKDIVIRAGRNIYPHELEEVIGTIPGIRSGSVAVFGSADPASGTERLVIMTETRESQPERIEGLRQAVTAAVVGLLGVPPDDVVLSRPHTVPKTSSGKIRRAASRELYERGQGGDHRTALRVADVRPEGRRRRRAVLDRLFWLYAAAWVGLLAPAVWSGVVLAFRPAQAWAGLRAGGRLLFRVLGIPLVVRGLEHLPRGAACIVAVNHSSHLDGLVVAAALPGAFTVVAKREAADNPMLRPFLTGLGALFVERFDPQRGAQDARAMVQAAMGGQSLVFFPEGTFTRRPGLQPFFLGGFLAAVESGVPVVPVVLRGTRSILRDGRAVPRRGTITVTIDPALCPSGSGWAAAVDLRARVRARMLALVGEPDLSADVLGSARPVNPSS